MCTSQLWLRKTTHNRSFESSILSDLLFRKKLKIKINIKVLLSKLCNEIS